MAEKDKLRINFDHNLHQPTHLFIYSFVYIYLFSFGNILVSYFIIFILCFIGPVLNFDIFSFPQGTHPYQIDSFDFDDFFSIGR